jgi:hypothetical protein
VPVEHIEHGIALAAFFISSGEINVKPPRALRGKLGYFDFADPYHGRSPFFFNEMIAHFAPAGNGLSGLRIDIRRINLYTVAKHILSPRAWIAAGKLQEAL